MEYTSKLACGQDAWMIRENKMLTLPVGKVEIQVLEDNREINPKPAQWTSVTYGFRIFDAMKKFHGWEERPESEVFATKEDLLAALAAQV